MCIVNILFFHLFIVEILFVFICKFKNLEKLYLIYLNLYYYTFYMYLLVYYIGYIQECNCVSIYNQY